MSLTLPENPTHDTFYYTSSDGEKLFLDDIALFYLMRDEIIGIILADKDDRDDDRAFVGVICGGVFLSGNDYEPLFTGDLEELVKMVVDDPKWGAVKWCAIVRNMAPNYVIEHMKRDGSWDDTMQTLYDDDLTL